MVPRSDEAPAASDGFRPMVPRRPIVPDRRTSPWSVRRASRGVLVSNRRWSATESERTDEARL